ncbi:MAG: LamG domain-containing protein, partial [Kofleriaceae bacterium]
VLVDGPFPEQGHAADIAPDMYYELPGTLIKTGGLTIQFWMKFDGLVPSYDAYPFSDIDLDNGGGGLAIAIYETTGLQIQIHSQPDSGFIQASAPYPSDNAWHFIRVTHANGIASLCLDGSHVAQLTVAADVLQSARAPFLGANQVWSPQGGYFDGQLDDFRVFSGALPCAAN